MNGSRIGVATSVHSSSSHWQRQQPKGRPPPSPPSTSPPAPTPVLSSSCCCYPTTPLAFDFCSHSLRRKIISGAVIRNLLDKDFAEMNIPEIFVLDEKLNKEFLFINDRKMKLLMEELE